MSAVGVDIVDIKRISRLVKNDRFCRRVFSGREMAYCDSRKKPAQHYAVRFAAKEAVWKILGRREITHKDISVQNSPEGKPRVILSDKFRKLEKRISISLSHTDNYAVAVAVMK